MITLDAVKSKNADGQVELPFTGFGVSGECGIASVALSGSTGNIEYSSPNSYV